MDELLQGKHLTIQGGSGEVCLRPEDDRPLLLVAGGTGIGQALALAWAQTLRHPETPVELLACADVDQDLYFDDLLPDTPAFQSELVADGRRDRSNRGLTWLADNARRWTQNTQVMLSGGPPFVYAATDVLIESGIAENSLASDVYAWAPRGNRE
jgi:CDP-4-dehydro-6-deoxyglucose reductase